MKKILTLFVLLTAGLFGQNQLVNTLTFTSGINAGTTTPATITGSSGALTLTAAGTNKSITLTPSGTGSLVLSGTSVTVPDLWTVTSAGSINLTAGGTNKNVLLNPSGTGFVQIDKTGYSGANTSSFRVRNSAATDGSSFGMTGTSATSTVLWLNGQNNTTFFYAPTAFRYGIGAGSSSYVAFDGTTFTVAPTGATSFSFLGGGAITGNLTLSSTLTRSNLDTITITTNAGTIDVTKGAGSATNNAATTLTMSSDSATTQTYLSRDLVNSDASNARVFTLRNAATTTIATVTVPASTTIPVTLRSTGSAWILYGGALGTLDLPANTTPGTGDMISTTNPTTGLNSKSSVEQVVDAAASADINLGTFASGNTTAAPVTLTLTRPNTTIFIDASAALRTYLLPAASSAMKGWSVIYFVTAGTNHVNVKPATGEALYLNGAALTANHYIQAATSATGNFICLVCDGTNWGNFGSSGTWADASSP